nr:uncharacterized protein LOC111775556 [Equus caballus]XP_023507482.1 uncharacterized protein LOC111775556 [Equus caballus]XP_023507483.1 uncharacterized protein LOC111775556 [Equus caballus]
MGLHLPHSGLRGHHLCPSAISRHTAVSALPPLADLRTAFGIHTSAAVQCGSRFPGLWGQEEAGQARPQPVMWEDTFPGRQHADPQDSSPARTGEGIPEPVGRCPQGCTEDSHPRNLNQNATQVATPVPWARSELQSFLLAARCTYQMPSCTDTPPRILCPDTFVSTTATSGLSRKGRHVLPEGRGPGACSIQKEALLVGPSSSHTVLTVIGCLSFRISLDSCFKFQVNFLDCCLRVNDWMDCFSPGPANLCVRGPHFTQTWRQTDAAVDALYTAGAQSLWTVQPPHCEGLGQSQQQWALGRPLQPSWIGQRSALVLTWAR